MVVGPRADNVPSLGALGLKSSRIERCTRLLVVEKRLPSPTRRSRTRPSPASGVPCRPDAGDHRLAAHCSLLFGALDYGFAMNGIIGLDFLHTTKAIIDLSELAAKSPQVRESSATNILNQGV